MKKENSLENFTQHYHYKSYTPPDVLKYQQGTNTSSTPQLLLPKIPGYLQSTPHSGIDSIDQLETYVHSLITQ